MGESLDLVTSLVAGTLLLVVIFALLVRRDRRYVAIDDDGLDVGARTFAWKRIARLDFVRGGYGSVFCVTTREGPVRFDDEYLEVPVDDIKRAIVAGAGLVREPYADAPVGIAMHPGDVHETWVRRGEEQSDGSPRWEDVTESDDAPARNVAGWAALVAIVAKSWKFIVGALHSANLMSFVPTLLSMFASAWVYAQLGGWPFALGLVGLLVLHELGHAAVMVSKGLRTTPIVFVPMFGAFIAIKDQFRDASVEAETALGGPVMGAISATACLAVFHVTGDPFWAALAFFGGLLNLFNLMPVSPLDGGRVVTAISTWLWVVGIAAILGMAAISGHPVLVLIAMLGALRAYRTWRAGRPRGEQYYALSGGYRTLMALAYFAVCGYLAWLTIVARELADAAAAA